MQMCFGYYIAFCFVFIVAAFLGVLGGFLTFLLTKRKTKSSVLAGIVVFFIVILGTCGYVGIYLPNDFYRYAGDFDYYRIPLDYPYELSMIDSMDCAAISKWKSDETIISGITHYYRNGNVVIGRTSDACFIQSQSEWFLFDTRTGKLSQYENSNEFDQAIQEIGFDRKPNLRTVQENWNLYWNK